MYRPNPIEELLGGLSPMQSAKSGDSNHGSVSFAGGKPSSSGMSIDQDSMDTSSTRRAPLGEVQNTFEFPKQQPAVVQPAQQRQQPAAPVSKPLGNFTTGVGGGGLGAAAGFSAKPGFAFGGGGISAAAAPAAKAVPPPNKTAAAAAGDSRRVLDQAMVQRRESPEPATPASVTSADMRGGDRGPSAAGAPPLTTLASLSKMGGGGGLQAASDSDADTTVTPLANMHVSHVPLSSYNNTMGMMTPEGATTTSSSSKAGGGSATWSSKIVWGDILMWRSPLQTATVFVAGAAAFWLANFAAYGAHKMTLMSAVSYLLIADLFCNFFRYFVSKGWHEQCLWGGAAQMKHFLTSLNAHVLHLAAAHDRYLSAADPFVTLKVAGGLWAAAWVGCFLSLWWAVVLAYVGAFTVPVTYSMCKPRLQALVKNIRAHTIDRVDAMGLPRTVRFLACVAVVATMWVTTSFTQSAIGFFVACTYWRTLLAPREIDAFRTVAEPYTISAFKVGRRISTAAGDVFDRMSTAGPKSRTKSHFGHKQRME